MSWPIECKYGTNIVISPLAKAKNGMLEDLSFASHARLTGLQNHLCKKADVLAKTLRTDLNQEQELLLCIFCTIITPRPLTTLCFVPFDDSFLF